MEKATSTDDADLAEIGYLGGGAMLSVGGMTFPNGRVARLLSSSSDMKILLLLFDGFLVTGGRIVRDQNDAPALTPIATRVAATLKGHEMNWIATTPVDVVAEQLADLGLLTLVPAGALIEGEDIESLLLGLMDAISEFPVPDSPLELDEVLAFDGGPLEPLMDDATVLWLMEELQRLGLAVVEGGDEPLFAYMHDDGVEEDAGSAVTVFGVTSEVSDFYAAMCSQVVQKAGLKHNLAVTPLRSGSHLPRALWKSAPTALPSYADLAFLHADLLDLDLDSVPLDEIIDFRQHHGRERRRFLRQMRAVLRAVGPLDTTARAAALRDYHDEAVYLAEALARSARRVFRRRGRDLLLGGAGAVMTGMANPLAGAIAGSRTALGLAKGETPDMFTYFYEARRSLAGARRYG